MVDSRTAVITRVGGEEVSEDRLFSAPTLSPFKKTNTKFLPFSKDRELSHTTLLDFKLILIQSKGKAAHMYKQGVLLCKTRRVLECASS